MKRTSIAMSIRIGIMTLSLLALASCNGYLEIFPIAALNPSKLNNPIDPALNPDANPDTSPDSAIPDATLVKAWTFEGGIDAVSLQGNMPGKTGVAEIFQGRNTLKIYSNAGPFTGWDNIVAQLSITRGLLTKDIFMAVDVYIPVNSFSNNSLNISCFTNRTGENGSYRNMNGINSDNIIPGNWYRVILDFQDWNSGNTDTNNPLTNISEVDQIGASFGIGNSDVFGPFYISRIALYKTASVDSLTGASPLLAPLSGAAMSASDKSVTITWTPPTETWIKKARISWTPTSSGPTQPIDVSPADGSATITGLTNYTNYKFSLAVVDEYGNTGKPVTTALIPKGSDAPGTAMKEWTFENGLNGLTLGGGVANTIFSADTWQGKNVLKIGSTQTAFPNPYWLNLNAYLDALVLGKDDQIVIELYCPADAIASLSTNVSFNKNTFPGWRSSANLDFNGFAGGNWYRLTFDLKDWDGYGTDQTNPLSDISTVNNMVFNLGVGSNASKYGPYYISRIAVMKSNSSTSVTGLTPMLPALTGVTATAQDKAVKIDWTAPSDPAITKVKISWTPTSSGPTQPVEIAASAGTTTIGSLLAGARYTFSIASEDAQGNTGQVETKTVTTPSAAAGTLVKEWLFSNNSAEYALIGSGLSVMTKAITAYSSGSVLKLTSTQAVSGWTGVSHTLDGLVLGSTEVLVVEAYLPSTMTSFSTSLSIHAAGGYVSPTSPAMSSGTKWYRLVYDLATASDQTAVANATDYDLYFYANNAIYGPVYIYRIAVYTKGGSSPAYSSPAATLAWTAP